MNRVKITPNFYLDEFIDPSIYATRGERSINLMDYRIIKFTQWLRELTGAPIIVNNWASGGQYKESGLRRANTMTGAKWSQHKYGRAVDLKCSTMKPRELFDVILKYEDYVIKEQLCTTIENTLFTPTWLHCDCRYTGMDKILIVNP